MTSSRHVLADLTVFWTQSNVMARRVKPCGAFKRSSGRVRLWCGTETARESLDVWREDSQDHASNVAFSALRRRSGRHVRLWR